MVERHDLASRVTALIAQVNEEQQTLEGFDLHTPFEQLGFDWLSHAELVMRLEEEFALIIPDEDAQALVSPQMVIAYLSKATRSVI